MRVHRADLGMLSNSSEVCKSGCGRLQAMGLRQPPSPASKAAGFARRGARCRSTAWHGQVERQWFWDGQCEAPQSQDGAVSS